MREGFEQTGNIQQYSTGYFQVAAGNTAQRPATANNGMLRYNTDYQIIEHYMANAWTNVSTLTSIISSTLVNLTGISVTTSNGVATVGYNIAGLPSRSTISSTDTFALSNGVANYQSNVGTLISQASVVLSSTFLSQTSANAIFLSQTTANATFITQSNASSTYLSQANASSTYLSQANANAIFLTQSNAASTYLSQANAASTYQTVANANATSQAVANIANTYLPLAGGTMTGSINMSNSSQLVLNNGTVSAPVITFTGDTNTGIWHGNNSTMSLVSNGTVGMTMSKTSNGMVAFGIGTQNPQYPIDIQGANGIAISIGSMATQVLNSMSTMGPGIGIKQYGDALGGSLIAATNRVGASGATINNYTGAYVDINFLPSTGQTRNLRLETRTANSITGGTEFQIGGNTYGYNGVNTPSTTSLAVGDTLATFQVPVILPNGSAASPSLSLAAATNTGLYYTGYLNAMTFISGGGTSNVTQLTIQAVAGYPSFLFTSSDATNVPTGTTAQRPPNVAAYGGGFLRFNTTTSCLEVYTSTTVGWANLNSTNTYSTAPSASNDVANGYSVGSIWVTQNSNNQNYAYISTNSTTGNATWTSLTPVAYSPGYFKSASNGSTYYGPIIEDNSTIGSQAYATGTIYYVPIFVGAGMTFDRVGSYLVSSTPGGNMRMALYSNNYPLGSPNSLILDLGNITIGAGATAAAKEYSITPITPATSTIYWIAWQASAAMTFSCSTLVSGTASTWLGRASPGGAGITSFTQSATFGAFPSNVASNIITNSSTTNNPPYMWLRNV